MCVRGGGVLSRLSRSYVSRGPHPMPPAAEKAGGGCGQAGGLPRPLRHPSGGRRDSPRPTLLPWVWPGGGWTCGAGSCPRPSRAAGPLEPAPGKFWGNLVSGSRRQRVGVRVSCCRSPAGHSGGLSLVSSLPPGHQTEGHLPGSTPSQVLLGHGHDLNLQRSLRQGGAGRALPFQNQQGTSSPEPFP